MDRETEVERQDLFTTETAGLPEAGRSSILRLHDGDPLELGLGSVRKNVEGAELRIAEHIQSGMMFSFDVARRVPLPEPINPSDASDIEVTR